MSRSCVGRCRNEVGPNSKSGRPWPPPRSPWPASTARRSDTSTRPPANPSWSTQPPARYSTSAARGSDMADEIYIPLVDEGVDVYRPAPAHQIGPSTYIVLRPDDYDPEDENWAFPP